MTAEQIQALQQEFGLSYHIEYASLAQQLVGFRNKRVLEVGGIEELPEQMEGQFDLVFSIAAFEHVARLP